MLHDLPVLGAMQEIFQYGVPWVLSSFLVAKSPEYHYESDIGHGQRRIHA